MGRSLRPKRSGRPGHGSPPVLDRGRRISARKAQPRSAPPSAATEGPAHSISDSPQAAKAFRKRSTTCRSRMNDRNSLRLPSQSGSIRLSRASASFASSIRPSSAAATTVERKQGGKSGRCAAARRNSAEASSRRPVSSRMVPSAERGPAALKGVERDRWLQCQEPFGGLAADQQRYRGHRTCADG